MKINTVKEVIKTAIQKKINTKIAPLNLVGHTGIGKTQMLKDLASELGIPLHIFRLGSMQDVGDMLGAPYVATTGETKYGVPEWYQTIQNGGILFLDEINRTKPALIDAVMQLLDQGKFNGYTLPDNCYLIAAMNPADENYDVNEFDNAVIDRCVNVPVTQTSEDVINYMIATEFDEDVIDFTTLAKDNINVGTSAIEIPKKQFTPRNLRQLNVWMPVIKAIPDAADEIVLGCVGPTGYSVWKNREILKQVPTAEMYFKEPEKYEVEKYGGIEKTILLTRVVNYLKKKKPTDEIKTKFSTLLVRLGDQLIAYAFRLATNELNYLNKFIDNSNKELVEKCKEIASVLRGAI